MKRSKAYDTSDLTRVEFALYGNPDDSSQPYGVRLKFPDERVVDMEGHQFRNVALATFLGLIKTGGTWTGEVPGHYFVRDEDILGDAVTNKFDSTADIAASLGLGTGYHEEVIIEGPLGRGHVVRLRKLMAPNKREIYAVRKDSGKWSLIDRAEFNRLAGAVFAAIV